MFIVHVFFHIRPEQIGLFKEASVENAKSSIKELGVISFDILQQEDDSSRFLFIEIYQTPNDQNKHRETSHYKNWRQLIENMLAEPCTFIKYNKIVLD